MGEAVWLHHQPLHITASLDLAYQLEIASLIRKLNAMGIAILISTHDLTLAASVCRDLVLLREGRVLATGPTQDVLTESMVRSLYGVDAVVTRHPVTDHVLVIPVDSADEQTQ